MSRIIISPSQQPDNRYADGSGSEEQHMESVCDKITVLLRAAGHEVYSPRTGSYTTQVQAGNRWQGGGDLYVAVHTNATGSSAGPRRGVEAYVMPAGVDDVGRSVASAICRRVAALGIPNRGLWDGAHLLEVNGPIAPCCLVELDYHDSAAGAAWIGRNHDALARAVASGICEILGGTLPTPAAAQATPPRKDTSMFMLKCAAEGDSVYLVAGTRITPIPSLAEYVALTNAGVELRMVKAGDIANITAAIRRL